MKNLKTQKDLKTYGIGVCKRLRSEEKKSLLHLKIHKILKYVEVCFIFRTISLSYTGIREINSIVTILRIVILLIKIIIYTVNIFLCFILFSYICMYIYIYT